MESLTGGRHPSAAIERDLLGGVRGNESLTIVAASVLTLLLAAEGVTLLTLNALLSVHMFIGLILIPPVLIKLASTGYRFARYYTRSRPYVDKGPPALPMRLLAPVLVLSTIGIFVTGVLLLALGHKSDQLVLLHKASFIVWAGVFGIHFLVYAPRVLRSVFGSAQRPPGSGLRGVLIAASLGAGAALAISLTSAISGWGA